MFDQLSLPAKKDSTCFWPGLPPSAAGLAIAEKIKPNQTYLVVTDSASRSHQLAHAIQFFVNEEDRHRVSLFPDYETLPYDFFSPSEDLISDRLRILYELASETPLVLVANINALMHQLTPPNFVLGGSLSIQNGDKFDPEIQRKRLVDAGYMSCETVTEHGQFAVRGSLLDLFPMGQDMPLRIDLFDDEIESIRRFDPDTQLTVEKIDSVEILPGREFSLTREAIHHFQNQWHQSFEGNPRDCQVYEAVGKGFSPQGVESYLPLFHTHMASLFDYLPDSTELFLHPDIASAAEDFWHEISNRYEQFGGNLDRPVLRPVELYLPAAEVLSKTKNYLRTQWGQSGKPAAESLPDVALKHKDEIHSRDLQKLIGDTAQTLVLAETAGRREVLAELLERDGVHLQNFDSWLEFASSGTELGVSIAPLEEGFKIANDFALITEAELLNERVRQQTGKSEAKRWVDADQVIRNLTELRIGAPVVHIEHGVGRYLGLVTLKTDGQANEFLHLEYAEKNKLYVPVTSLNLISRYSGADADSAPLNRLGSEQWEKAKRKAREQIRDTAAELLDIYARRMAKPGHAFTDNETDYIRFCEEFPFEETEDQLTCIAAVREDMLTPRAMDRLVCGDVGFGKTEVAMRAAFTAVSSSKQVMMLVPTTLLARQHYDSFRDRFANWPVQIDSVSRLKSAKEQDNVLNAFQDGKLDILIGTHKLLGQKPDSTRLGLLIVDEEHRFGVRQKEQLKSLKAEVDILTLTATPIPRTLNMAMASIRDLSIIATPPAKRLMAKTFVRPYEKAIVREAIQRELLRGGQVFYLHNEVRSIDRCAEGIRELVPNARIGVAHGQMRERDLETTISDFYHHRYDILVCSTIVETGIDIPNANTMIIERADKFGLAQLHQLRGRVGRSHHQAYAYLLTPDAKSMTSDAVKRLEAIEAADHLGSGFTLATHDLEIRGAGELLGDNQSGQIHAIGFDLYQQMLEAAVKSLQSGDKEAQIDLQEQSVEVNLRASALIPEDYLPDVNGRLQLYKRIANSQTEEALRELQVEMIDRYGLLPPQVKLLVRQQLIKQMAEQLGIKKIECGERSGKVKFVEQPNIDPMKLIGLVQNDPAQYRFDGATALQFTRPLDSAEERFAYVENLIQELSA